MALFCAPKTSFPAVVTGLFSIAIVWSCVLKVSVEAISRLWVVGAEASAAGRLSEFAIGPSAIGLLLASAAFGGSLGGSVLVTAIPAIEAAGDGCVASRVSSARFSSGAIISIEGSADSALVPQQLW